MTTARQKGLMLAAILGLSGICGYEAMGLHLWNTLAFGLMAVACAAMFVVQVGEERPCIGCGVVDAPGMESGCAVCDRCGG